MRGAGLWEGPNIQRSSYCMGHVCYVLFSACRLAIWLFLRSCSSCEPAGYVLRPQYARNILKL